MKFNSHVLNAWNILTTRVQLKTHMNIHLELRLYTCNVCDNAFTQSTDLSVHRRTHHIAHPYMCSICGKTFAIASNVRKHTAIHERDVAGQALLTKDTDLEPRPSSFPPELLPFPCNYCDERLYSLKNPSIHERRVYGKEHACPHVGCRKSCVSAS